MSESLTIVVSIVLVVLSIAALCASINALMSDKAAYATLKREFDSFSLRSNSSIDEVCFPSDQMLEKDFKKQFVGQIELQREVWYANNYERNIIVQSLVSIEDNDPIDGFGYKYMIVFKIYDKNINFVKWFNTKPMTRNQVINSCQRLKELDSRGMIEWKKLKKGANNYR